MEHCGDDFLAALAESVEDSEEWDDLQDMESEACGTLKGLLGKGVLNNDQSNSSHMANSDTNIIEDFSSPQTNQNFVEIDSSSDNDLDFVKVYDIKSSPSSFSNWKSYKKVLLL